LQGQRAPAVALSANLRMCVKTFSRKNAACGDAEDDDDDDDDDDDKIDWLSAAPVCSIEFVIWPHASSAALPALSSGGKKCDVNRAGCWAARNTGWPWLWEEEEGGAGATMQPSGVQTRGSLGGGRGVVDIMVGDEVGREGGEGWLLRAVEDGEGLGRGGIALRKRQRRRQQQRQRRRCLCVCATPTQHHHHTSARSEEKEEEEAEGRFELLWTRHKEEEEEEERAFLGRASPPRRYRSSFLILMYRNRFTNSSSASFKFETSKRYYFIPFEPPPPTFCFWYFEPFFSSFLLSPFIFFKLFGCPQLCCCFCRCCFCCCCRCCCCMQLGLLQLLLASAAACCCCCKSNQIRNTLPSTHQTPPLRSNG